MSRNLRLLAVIALLSTVAAQDYTQAGPCSSTAFTFKKVPVSENQTVPVYVTLPTAGSAAATDIEQAPYPVVFFLNGFECTACLYKSIAERLASWCFAVVQYDGPIATFSKRPFVTDAEEVKWIPALQLWLDQQNSLPGSRLFERLDLDSIAVAGHSRGGKLAVLQFGANKAVQAAYLLDPDDSTRCSTPSFTRASPDYPNAAPLLAGKQVAISGAGLTGSCDSDCNGPYYDEFLGNASSGSVLYTIAGAGHFSFAQPLTWKVWECPQGQIVKLFGIPLCNGVHKTLGGADTIALTTPTMVAWFQSQLRDIPVPDSFDHWLSTQQDAGKLSVTVKQPPKPASDDRASV